MITPPLDVVLTWPTPNYVDPETRGPANEIVAITLWIAATVIVTIRLYARKRITHGFGADDIFIILAWFPATAFGACGLVSQYVLHWDRHIWDVPFDSIEKGVKLAFVNLILFDLATSLTKLSMLALLYRLVNSSKHSRLRPLCKIIGVVISINCVVFMGVLFLQCRPFSDNWTITFTGDENCTVNEAAHLLAAGIINTVTDFAMVLLPMAVVYRVQRLPRRQLVVVNMLFAVGFFACVAGIVRTYYTWIMSVNPNYDSTWHAWMTWLFSAVELYVGLICASIPATKPFFGRFVPELIRSTYCMRSSRDASSTDQDGTERHGGGRDQTSSVPLCDGLSRDAALEGSHQDLRTAAQRTRHSDLDLCANYSSSELHI